MHVRMDVIVVHHFVGEVCCQGTPNWQTPNSSSALDLQCSIIDADSQQRMHIIRVPGLLL
jgi:hypothetical protein